MKNIVQQLQKTRRQLLNRARQVSVYFSESVGLSSDQPVEPKPLAWTSDEQKKRAQEFHKVATELAEKKRAA